VDLVVIIEYLLIDAAIVDLTTLVIWLEMKGGKITPITIVEVGFIGAPNLETYEVPSIRAY
jgi:hypothetical protein